MESRTKYITSHSVRHCSYLLMMSLLLTYGPLAHAQTKQTVQIKTFDQQLQVLRNVEVSINGKPFTSVGSRGVALVELDSDDIPIRSITLKDANLEAASWNFSKGIVEVVVRPKPYTTMRIALRYLGGQVVSNTRVTFRGSKDITLTSNGQGEFDLPLPIGEKILSKDQFVVEKLVVSKIVLTDASNVIFVEPPLAPIPEEPKQEPASVAKASSEFDLTRLDSIKSLTVFYAVFKDISIKSLSPEVQQRIDRKFNELIGHHEDSLTHSSMLFIDNISDSSVVSEDVRNLLNQATLEMSQLESNRDEFEEKIQVIADKLERGLTRLTESEKSALLADLDRLEALLIQNESQFYKNQNDYREIVNGLRERYFDVAILHSKLSESELQKEEQRTKFRQQLLIAGGALVAFAVLIILLISFSNRLKKQANDLRAANEEISTINENLEGIVIRRTSALEESNRELDTFLYRASHDLRSPIRSIIGLCNISDYIAPAEYLSRVQATTTMMDRMLTKLISISEIGQEADNLTEVDAVGLVDGITARYAGVMKEKNIQFHVDCQKDLVVRSNLKLLDNILTNLLENAIFFSSLKSAEHARIEIQVRPLEGAWGFVVYDNGVGVEKASVDRLFEMFYKANEYSQGNGLGLYLVNKSVRALGGRITVESESMRYTKFKVVFPMH